ncbi:MAG: alkaline phosphatase family protein [Solirubrobacteraceae bacterium]
MRDPGSRPFPDEPVGAVNDEMPFDHIVVVMMENHSFDNLLGELGRTGQADGLTFDAGGATTNSNPGADGEVRSFAFGNTAQATHVSQSWNATHEQIDGGKMDGFVRSVGANEPMGYFPPDVLPFAYSLASTFTVANRWFCSVPGPTYPNRRFLLAGTAFGGIATDPRELLDASAPNGTIFDRLQEAGISWRNYFTDFPLTFVIPSTLKHVTHYSRIARFYEDCTNGSLPAVSFVDPAIGAASKLVAGLKSVPGVGAVLDALGVRFGSPGETEEDPQSMYYGEVWAHKVIQALLDSPSWARTLLIYTYDEHGGYYDHVAPPTAIEPDSIPPKLQPGDAAGAYDIYGPRVPAIVVSPYSKPNGVTDVVHDHTSVLATIEAKWNLPALTFRDANAATVMDFLDPSDAALLQPPVLESPAASGPSGPP